MGTRGAQGLQPSRPRELEILAGLFLCGSLAWATPACLPSLLAAPGGEFRLREAWDVGVYWWAVLPLMIAVAGLGGFGLGGQAGRVALALMAGHLLAMLALAPRGAGVGLLPLTLVLLAVLALPQLAAAALGGWLCRRCAAA
jgi:hypothetical protein